MTERLLAEETFDTEEVVAVVENIVDVLKIAEGIGLLVVKLIGFFKILDSLKDDVTHSLIVILVVFLL